MKRLTMQDIAEISGGRWIVQPENLKATVRHFALYGDEVRRDIGQENVLFAMSQDHWRKGSGNSGVYLSTFKDNHERVHTLQRFLKMAIVERPVPDATVPQLLVDDAYKTLQKLTLATAKSYTGKTIAVTGSVGKSTTKRLIAYLLAKIGPTTSTIGNHNSRTSVKLQAMNHDLGMFNVLEIAAMALSYQEPNHNIGGVSGLLNLDLAVLTQIDAGQKGWSARKNADVKTRLGANLKPNQPFLVNGEIKNLKEVIQFINRYTNNVITYGLTADCDYHGQLTNDGQMKIWYHNQLLGEVAINGLDNGLIIDMLGALATFDLFGGKMSTEIMKDFGLECAHTTTQKTGELQVNGHHVTIVDDTHNAELLSIKNFIKFAKDYETKPNVKKIYIEGRVINLRNISYKTHLEVVNLLNAAGFDKYYLYGPEMDMVVPAAKQPAYGGYYTTPNQMVKAIAKELNQDLVIFIKADSRENSIGHVRTTLEKNLAYEASTAKNFAMTVGFQNDQAYIRCGVGRLLVILQALQKVASGKLKLTEPVTIKNALAKDHSINKVGLKLGAQYTIYDLLTTAIVTAAPDVIISLAEYSYGSNQKAFEGLQTFAKKLDLSADTVHNITGRPTRRLQKTYLADLEKIGSAFTKLPDEVLSLLSTQRRQVNGKLYQKKSQLFKTGKIIGSVFLDWREHAGLYFWVNHQGIHTIAFINSPHSAYVDFLIENLIDSGVTQQDDNYVLESVKLTNPTVNILADTYFGEDYTRKRQRRGIEDSLQKYGYTHSFEKIKSFFGAKQYNILNFEAVFASGDSPLDAVKPFVLDADVDKTLAEFKRLGFNLAMLGNNHANDYGGDALVDTLTKFKQAGMQTVGAGRNQLDSRKVVELVYDEHAYAIFNGYWYRNPAYNIFDFYAKASKAGVNCLDTLMAADIQRYKKEHPDAKVIVSAHWGTDYGDIHSAQRITAERLTLAGADLIIGHGPHRLQPIEYYGQTPVLYSIGNGVFNNSGSFKQLKVPPYAAIVRLDLSQNQLYWCPIYADNSVTFWQPSFVSDVDFEQIRAINPAHFETVKLDGEINAVVIPF
ncbi:hypothetical protein EFP00_10755 [Lactiplantibacillus paraplantarum]|uniref:CapA family protein n=1 Tax=Lactiplantibacillus paraplantarum TaxID=60520 RepID=UPI0021A6C727|nr:CapA family protein [Lactiplantibacillus paraplantarum]MCT4457878.1 hypothetical protein [Lactiplantibacillus paraplantarum]